MLNYPDFRQSASIVRTGRARRETNQTRRPSRQAAMTFWIVNILNGLSLAMILFLLASWLTLAFGLMRIVNMAHGSFYLLGAYLAFSAMQASGYFLLGAVIAVMAAATLGMAIQ